MHAVARRWNLVSFVPALLATALAVPTHAQEPATVKPVPRGGGWTKVHERFVDRAKQGGIDLLFLGDSITQGWNDNEVWKRYYGPRNAANFGIGGDRTEHVLWRIENGEIDGISPKVAVLMIGTNNAKANTAGEIAQGIETIVKTLREKLPKTKILLLGVFPRDPSADSPLRAKLGEVNERVAKLDDGSMVTYLDIGKRFTKEDGTLTTDVMPDFLHLSRKGYRIWADAMEPTLWKMLDDEKVKSDLGAKKAAD